MLLHAYEDAEDEWTFTEGTGNMPKSWILLHNQSTVSFFSSPALLKNIRKINSSVNVHCNAGVVENKNISSSSYWKNELS
jgi:hypothetical protein